MKDVSYDTVGSKVLGGLAFVGVALGTVVVAPFFMLVILVGGPIALGLQAAESARAWSYRQRFRRACRETYGEAQK